MKLQIKLTLYNTLTKIAIILVTGILILASLENISYHHISVRLREKKKEFLENLSSAGISYALTQKQSFTDYNILKDDYIQVRPAKYQPVISAVDSFSTDKRTIEQSTDTYRILNCKFNYNNHTYSLEIGNTLDNVESLKQTIQGFTLVILIIALSLTLITDLIFTKFLLNPFYKIIENKLIRVNDPLNFDYKPINTTTYDFKLLDGSINSLMKKITHLFVLEKQFIANVSHELLTPISILSSRLENVLTYETLSVEAENKIYGSLKTLNRLKAIINSLLLISKVENNQYDKNDIVKLPDIITEINEELEDRLEDREISFNKKLKYQYALIGNKALMHTLLFNIINNAIKYNQHHGSITISDNILQGRYRLDIIDTGIGMNREQIEKAFNRFEKLDTDEKESFGLGLAIVKSIASFHDININITSEKNQGTTFTLIFNEQANFTKSSS